MTATLPLRIQVNGRSYEHEVEPRKTLADFLRENPGQTDEQAIREAISGVICRCTGYQQIVEAIQSVAAQS